MTKIKHKIKLKNISNKRELLKTKGGGTSNDLSINSESIIKYLVKNKQTFNLIICLRKSFVNESKLNQFLKQKR